MYLTLVIGVGVVGIVDAKELAKQGRVWWSWKQSRGTSALIGLHRTGRVSSLLLVHVLCRRVFFSWVHVIWKCVFFIPHCAWRQHHLSLRGSQFKVATRCLGFGAITSVRCSCRQATSFCMSCIFSNPFWTCFDDAWGLHHHFVKLSQAWTVNLVCSMSF